MDEYIDQFLSEGEGSARVAAKRLTAQIERELVESTINAPDWYVLHAITLYFAPTLLRDTLYAARMARDLLWAEERSINLDDYVAISQT